MGLGGCRGLGEREETGAVVCVKVNVADDVINWVETCGARGREEGRKIYIISCFSINFSAQAKAGGGVLIPPWFVCLFLFFCFFLRCSKLALLIR